MGITELVWIICVFVFRLSHTGRVCSGEYLTPQYDDVPGIIPFTTYVDIASGVILMGAVYVLSVILGIFALLGIVFLIMYLVKKNKSEPETENEGGVEIKV